VKFPGHRAPMTQNALTCQSASGVPSQGFAPPRSAIAPSLARKWGLSCNALSVNGCSPFLSSLTRNGCAEDFLHYWEDTLLISGRPIKHDGDVLEHLVNRFHFDLHSFILSLLIKFEVDNTVLLGSSPHPRKTVADFFRFARCQWGLNSGLNNTLATSWVLVVLVYVRTYVRSFAV
jgi:hypothetical protein